MPYVACPGGWTPELAAVFYSGNAILQVINWFGGNGPKPPTGLYVGPLGLTDDPDEATIFYSAGGLPLDLDNPQVGDILQFNGLAWANVSIDDLTDGGYF